ncbi:LppX_LprAFG lipoprotein [Gordonia sp. NPDC003950]
MQRAQRVATAAVAAGIAAALALTGCSSGSESGSSGSTTATSTITDPAALVSAAADSTAALTGAHLNLAVTGTIPNLTAKAVEADVTTKPQMAAKGTATVLLGTTEVKAPFVYVDKHLYADIGGQGFVDYGDGRSIYDVSVVLDPDKGLANLLRQIQNPTKTGAADVDGVQATQVTGTVAAMTLAPLTGVNVTANQDAQVPITVWITADNQLARVAITPVPNSSMTITLSKWNDTVEVSKPSQIVTPSASTPPNPADASRVPA